MDVEITWPIQTFLSFQMLFKQKKQIACFICNKWVAECKWIMVRKIYVMWWWQYDDGMLILYDGGGYHLQNITVIDQEKRE